MTKHAEHFEHRQLGGVLTEIQADADTLARAWKTFDAAAEARRSLVLRGIELERQRMPGTADAFQRLPLSRSTVRVAIKRLAIGLVLSAPFLLTAVALALAMPLAVQTLAAALLAMLVVPFLWWTFRAESRPAANAATTGGEHGTTRGRERPADDAAKGSLADSAHAGQLRPSQLRALEQAAAAAKWGIDEQEWVAKVAAVLAGLAPDQWRLTNPHEWLQLRAMLDVHLQVSSTRLGRWGETGQAG